MSTLERGILAVADAIARFPLELGLFDTAMQDLVDRVCDMFGFHTASIACLDAPEWTVRRILGREGSAPCPPTLVQDFAAEVRIRHGEASDLVLWRDSNHSPIRVSAQSPNPIAVASISGLHDRQTIMLVGERDVDAIGAPPDPQTLRTITGLIARLVEKHDRFAASCEQQRRSEEQRRIEAIGTFADGIAHDFNNLLAAMMGYAEMARDIPSQPEILRDYVENIIEAGAQAQRVIDQILVFTRMRHNQAEPFELIEAIVEVLPRLYVCAGTQIGLAVDVPDPPFLAVGSSAALQEILVNLCNNASEALESEGDITLTIEPITLGEDRLLSHGQLLPGEYVRIAITDTGPGIAPEHFSRIAEPFFTTRTDGRAGLGLFVVHYMALSLDGAMHIANAPTKGTCVEVFLPCPSHEDLAMQAPQELLDVSLGSGQLVAVVDPVAASRFRWEEKLAAIGYEPVAFETIAALADWRRRTGSNPDVTLIDAQNRGSAVGGCFTDDLKGDRLVFVWPETVPPSHRSDPTGLTRPVSLSALADVLERVLRQANSLVN